MLDDALVAAETAKAGEAAARSGSRLECETSRVLRERAQLLEKSARLESKALQSQWHQVRLRQPSGLRSRLCGRSFAEACLNRCGARR